MTMPPANLDLLRKLELSLKSVGEQTRKLISLAGFDIFIDTNSAEYHLSFAVPTSLNTLKHDRAASKHDRAASILRLKEVFAQQGRRTRLEYFHDLYPDLKELLEEAGFGQDMRAPVMALRAQDLTEARYPKQGIYLRLKSKDKALVEKALRRQSLAYGGTGDDGSLIWLNNMLQGLEQDTLRVAVLEHSGDFVSGASVQIGGGIGELAGVWTQPNAQKQGYAFELCHQLLNDYFQAGYELCWLSAAEGAQRLYQKLGFSNLGTQLNYGLPK